MAMAAAATVYCRHLTIRLFFSELPLTLRVVQPALDQLGASGIAEASLEKVRQAVYGPGSFSPGMSSVFPGLKTGSRPMTAPV